MPTMIGFADGKAIGTIVGAKMAEITALIEKYVPSPSCRAHARS